MHIWHRPPYPSEGSNASLGMIGSIGFLILVLWIFVIPSRKLAFSDVALLDHLSMLNLSGILLSTVGGFGAIFSYLITSQLRGYDRTSIFIAFFSIAAFFVILENMSRCHLQTKQKKMVFCILIMLVAFVGVLDQTSPSFALPNPVTKADFFNDENFVHEIEAIMPENGMIFQLPYVPFPEYPPVNNMSDYAHFKGYLHSKSLK